MNTRSFFHPALLPVLTALVLLAACSKPAGPAGHTGGDGHGNEEHGHEEHGGATAHTATKDGVLMCTEHNVPEAECGICKPELATELQPGGSAKVRLASPDSASHAGIGTALPVTGRISDAVECYAELAYDQNKLARLASPVGGIVKEVAVDVGARVKENQPLAKIWSGTISEAVARAVLSHQTLERERKLRTERVTSQKDLQQAEAEHRTACQQARTFGFGEEEIDRMGANHNDPVYLEVRAPFAGEIVDRMAVTGALVEAGGPLFLLADRSVMWAMLNIPESSLARVKEGQTVELLVDSLPGRTFEGTLTWIASGVDEKTRMTRARVEVANPGGILKANMFARARILTRTTGNAVLLPASAVQRIGKNDFVFVKLEEDLFDARAVRVGAASGGLVEILEGVKPDETVAVEHVFPLKSAFLISRLGAGCADD